MARKSGVGRRGGVAAGVCGAGGAAALFAGMYGVGPWRGLSGRAAAAVGPGVAAEVTVASPRPYFVPLNGQGPALSTRWVAWTANGGQGAMGSPIDRIYVYDLGRRHLGAPIRSHYGAAGFIGGYALAADQLAYVDTGVTPARIVTWRVCVVDLRRGRARVVLTSPPGATTYIPPQVAFDGAHLLVLQSVNRGAAVESTATLYTLPRGTGIVLARTRSATTSLGDPALARDAALWTAQTFGPRPSSRLTMYDMRRHVARAVPVGDVSQLSASGDLVAWKSGLTSAPGGRIGLYSVGRGRVLSADLAHTDKVVYPAVGADLVSWTYADGSRVQVYSLTARRVVYSAPAVPHRVYGLSFVDGDALAGAAAAGRPVSWVYTADVVSRSSARGYVVVRTFDR